MDKTLAIGWFLTGALTVIVWQTQIEPRRKTRKANQDNLSGKKLTPFPHIEEHMKEATGA